MGAWGGCLWSVLVHVPRAVHAGQGTGATCRDWGWLLGWGVLRSLEGWGLG